MCGMLFKFCFAWEPCQEISKVSHWECQGFKKPRCNSYNVLTWRSVNDAFVPSAVWESLLSYRTSLQDGSLLIRCFVGAIIDRCWRWRWATLLWRYFESTCPLDGSINSHWLEPDSCSETGIEDIGNYNDIDLGGLLNWNEHNLSTQYMWLWWPALTWL